MNKSIYNEEYRALIRRLADARRDAGLTQNEAAQELGKPQSYISKVETLQRRLDVIEFLELAKLYGKTLNHFFKE